MRRAKDHNCACYKTLDSVANSTPVAGLNGHGRYDHHQRVVGWASSVAWDSCVLSTTCARGLGRDGRLHATRVNPCDVPAAIPRTRWCIERNEAGKIVRRPPTAARPTTANREASPVAQKEFFLLIRSRVGVLDKGSLIAFAFMLVEFARGRPFIPGCLLTSNIIFTFITQIITTELPQDLIPYRVVWRCRRTEEPKTSNVSPAPTSGRGRRIPKGEGRGSFGWDPLVQPHSQPITIPTAVMTTEQTEARCGAFSLSFRARRPCRRPLTCGPRVTTPVGCSRPNRY